MDPLLASTMVDESVIGAPSNCVNLPPASITIAAQAPLSSMLTSDS
jgi:hypothetical protein